MPERNTTLRPRSRKQGGTGHLPAEVRAAKRAERARKRELAEKLQEDGGSWHDPDKD
jgi:hypothetical protein